jgi:uncharacterized protein (DUF2336 family)
MNAEFEFFQEVEHAVTRSSGPRRADMASRLTDLLLDNSDRYSADEMTLIDDVFVRLVATIEESSRVLLSTRLAPLSKAPPRILRALACDDAIDVASPVLAWSEALDDSALIACAETKSQDHLLAISQRKTIAETVTDVLVRRGDERVVLSTAKNAGASLSDRGFAVLVDRAHANERLAICVGSRPDIPTRLFRQLLDSASTTVRAKLEAESPHLKADINRVVAGVAARIETHAAALPPKYAAALALVGSLNQCGKLNAAKLEAFATADRFEEVVAAFALMSGAPIDVVERRLSEEFIPFLLILAKATGLSWITVRVILLMLGIRHHRCAQEDIDKALVDFQQISRNTALRVLSVYREAGANSA